MINQLPSFQERPVDISIAFILMWLVRCSETTNMRDNPELQKQLTTLDLDSVIFKKIISILKLKNSNDFYVTLKIIRDQLEPEEKLYFFDLCIMASTSKTYLTPSANHALRLIRDLLEVNPEYLESQFQELKNFSLSDPDDLSDPDWWERKLLEEDFSEDADLSISRKQALTLLYLKDTALPDEIKKAYKQLAQQFHPDRSGTSGEQNKNRFMLIQKAYEVLKP